MQQTPHGHPGHGGYPQPHYGGPPQQGGYGAPQPPPPKRGMSGGKIAAIIGIACVGGCGVLVTVAALMANPNGGQASTAPTTAQPIVAPTEETVAEKPPAKARQPKLGEAFRLGDFTYVIKDVKVMDEVGKGYGKKAASDGAAFVVVQFTIQNEGNATETVLTDDFLIVDAKGREFRPSTDANMALAMAGGGKDMIVSELQPGLKKATATAFELPEASAKGTFTLVIPEKGLLGTGAVRITLK